MYYTYIIESEKDASWYYGSTEDPTKRIASHNAGLTKSTKSKLPWRFIFQRSFNTRQEALAFELYLKRMRNKAFIKEKFSEYFLG